MTTDETCLRPSASSRPTHDPPRTIGVLTIGQSPRPDRLGADIQAVLGSHARVVERGALDGLSDEEIAGLAPTEASTYRLITLLRDGRSVQLDKTTILELLQRHIRELETAQGVEAILLMCTGAFPAFEHSRPLLMPQQALYGAVTGLADGNRIGALIPLEAQRTQSLAKWREMGVPQVDVFPASPYGDDPYAAIKTAAMAAREAGSSILFMDCFGYDRAMKAVARDAFEGPVVLARTLAARLVDEISQ